jgi:proteic killer suppression protein
MDVEFEQREDKKLCENHQKLKRRHGGQATIIIKRINELEAAVNLSDIKCLPQTGFHALSGNYKGCYAVYLKHPYRLIFVPKNGNASDLETITKVSIVEVCTDYH